MIKIIRPDEGNYLILKHIFDEYKDEMKGDELKTVLNDLTFFFFETDSEKFIGCIYFYMRDNDLYVNAFATRGHHELNLYIFRQTLKLFNCPIYAECLGKTSKLCVLRCGFKKYKDNIYKYERSE